MNKIWSLYDPKTGLLLGRTISCPDEHLAANVPEGHATVLGRHDHLSQRVDLALLQADDDTAATAWAATCDANRLRRTAGADVKDPPKPGRTAATARHVVDYQPPAPSADHEWNPTAKRWVPNAAAQASANAKAAARARHAELLASQSDDMRRAVLGDKDAARRLMAIEDEVSSLKI
ncbi:MAG TPA: hypothetical protein VMF03_00215 [Steroidobacteraceae bacterium]|nr:hypothetical protein [Steroidobacteraceae bacterium]